MKRLKNSIIHGYPNFIKNCRFVFNLNIANCLTILLYLILYSIPYSIILGATLGIFSILTGMGVNVLFTVYVSSILDILILPILFNMATDKYTETHK